MDGDGDVDVVIGREGGAFGLLDGLDDEASQRFLVDSNTARSGSSTGGFGGADGLIMGGHLTQTYRLCIGVPQQFASRGMIVSTTLLVV